MHLPVNTRRVAISVLFLLATTLTSAQVVSAPSQSATLTGVVRDQAKNALAGALITATKLDDNTTQTAVSGTDGSYLISHVVAGMYSVMAEKEGFSQVVVSSLQISAGQ